MTRSIPLFYFADERPGGAQNLIVRVCLELQRRGHEFGVFDSATGYVRRVLQERGVPGDRFFSLDRSNDTRKQRLAAYGEEAIFVAFNGQPLIFYEQFRHTSARVVFWDIFTPSLKNTFALTGKTWLKPLNLILTPARAPLFRYLIQHKSIVSMDELGQLEIRRLSKTCSAFDVPVVPVPAATAGKQCERRRAEAQESRQLCAAYIGRPEVWKIRPFERVLADFGGHVSRFIVATTNSQQFESRLRIPKEWSGAIHFKEGLYGQALSELLASEADIVFGMGLSVLEGAALGIPSIVVDYSDEAFPEGYRYRWLCDVTPKYDLGAPVCARRWAGGGSAVSIVDDVLRQAQQIGARCYAKSMDYSVECVVSKLLDVCDGATATIPGLNVYGAIPLVQFWRKNISGAAKSLLTGRGVQTL